MASNQARIMFNGNPQRNNHMIKIQERAFNSQDDNIFTQMISHQNLNKPAATEESPGVKNNPQQFQETAQY